MSKENFILPDLGEGINSGTVLGYLVEPNTTVKKDQNILEIETDKATLELPAPFDGKILEFKVNIGDDISPRDLVAIIERSATQLQSSVSPSQKETQTNIVETEKSNVEQLVKENQVLTPTPNTSLSSTNTFPKMNLAENRVIPASPMVRHFAFEIGINLSQVKGSGHNGRISIDDVKKFSKQLNQQRSQGGGFQREIPSLPDFTQFGKIKTEKMSRIRQVTAKHMATCWDLIPHVTQFDEVDITELEQWRKKTKASSGIRLTITGILVQSLTKALKEFPQFNCSLDIENKQIILKKYCNIGIAVDTPNGLLVPVVKNSDQKNLTLITNDIIKLATKAKDRKIKPEDLQGGSITITNLGGIGGTAFTPIVNSPEVAILGVSSSSFKPIYNLETKEFEPRLIMPLCLSYDHRVIDGALATKFVRFICLDLQNSKMSLDS